MNSLTKLFLAEAMDGWAYSLAKKPNVSWDAVCELMKECAILDDDGGKPEPFPDIFELKQQRTVLALVRFLGLSRGKYQEELVPFLCQYFSHIGKFSWSISGSSQIGNS